MQTTPTCVRLTHVGPRVSVSVFNIRLFRIRNVSLYAGVKLNAFWYNRCWAVHAKEERKNSNSGSSKRARNTFGRDRPNPGSREESEGSLRLLRETTSCLLRNYDEFGTT